MFGLLARNWNWWPLIAQLELEHQNVLMRAVLLVKGLSWNEMYGLELFMHFRSVLDDDVTNCTKKIIQFVLHIVHSMIPFFGELIPQILLSLFLICQETYLVSWYAS